jgi:ribonuclease P/MRP protein subunit RPP40
VNGFKSGLFRQGTGVPQGSVLGPFLFNIFIDDIADHLDTPFLLFADHLKIYDRANSIEDSMRLQKNLDAVYEWCVTNKLLLNISKCNVMTYAREMNPLYMVYKINGSMLEKPDSIRDLGVSFNSKLSFNDHIDLVAQSAFK